MSQSAIPECVQEGHGPMGTDLELDQDGEPTGKLLWTCQVCCLSLPRGNIRWADQSGTPAGALVVCRACGKNPAVVGGGVNGRVAGSGKGRVRWDYRAKGDEHPFFGPRVPIHEVSRLGCEVVLACLRAIDILQPRYWWLENPQGGLQTMGFMREVPGPATITYCRYGDTRMKPTCLWGRWPSSWRPRPRCQNGDSCHVSAPRGSRTPGSTQGHKDAKTRAMVPEQLSEAIMFACENHDAKPYGLDAFT